MALVRHIMRITNKTDEIMKNEIELYCPQCGESVDKLHEGYCEACCNVNQTALDRHNAEFDYWNKMDNKRREEIIKRSYN